MSSRISKEKFIAYRVAKLVAVDAEDFNELCSLTNEEVERIERNYGTFRRRYKDLFT